MPQATDKTYTGNGWVVSFGTSGAVARIISIEGFDEELPDVEDSDLGTTGHMAYIPGDLIDHGELVLNVVFTEENNSTFVLGTEEVVTMTAPLRSGEATGAALSGDGWCKRRSMGSAENNERVTGQLVVRFAGGNASNVPAWTAAA